MTEQTEHVTAQPDATHTRIDLEDFIEAVSRGVARAWAAQDDVSGYTFGTIAPLSLGAGFVVYCPSPPPPDPRAPRADRLAKGD